MSMIQYNPQAVENRAAIRAQFEAAMNAQDGGIVRGGNTATIEQVAHSVKQRIANEARPAFFSKRDIIAAAMFGAVIFGGLCVAAALHLI